MKNVNELVRKIAGNTDFYDFDACEELFKIAGMSDRWNELIADGIVPESIPETIAFRPRYWGEPERTAPVTRSEYMKLWYDNQIGGFHMVTFEDALYEVADKLGIKTLF